MAGEGLAHLVGDYVVQSDWMAVEKTTRALPAAAHAVTYAACFLPVTRSSRTLLVIGGTHYLIDRYRLAKYVAWAKNQLAPTRWRHPWDAHVAQTGYHLPNLPGSGWQNDHDPTTPCQTQAKPTWLSFPLMVAADNTLHLLINRWAIRRFG